MAPPFLGAPAPSAAPDLPPAVVTSNDPEFERRMFLDELMHYRSMYLEHMFGPNWERRDDLANAFYCMAPRTFRTLKEAGRI